MLICLLGFMACIIFTDGASKGNPGPSGWGVVVSTGAYITELGSREARATNNQMELRAAAEGLLYAHRDGITHATVYADSSYVINGITKWIFGWKKHNWKTSTGGEVLNVDLWEQLYKLVYESGIKVTWKNVGGHIGIAGNERADVIASDFAENKKVELYSGPVEKYTVDISNLEHSQELHTAKSASRSRSKLKAYSYISAVDGVVKVHKTWAECEARVRGKKARYKKAVSPSEEKEIIKEFSK